MLRRHTDLLPARSLPVGIIQAFFLDVQHSQNPVDRCAEIMGHMGEKFALCRIGLPDLL